jgi:hypothetical protein
MRCAIKTCTHNIIVTDAPSIRLTFPVIKVHVDEFSSARIWQHKLCETLSASVNISSNQSILPYLYISESKFWCKFEKVKLTMKIIMFRLHMPVWHVLIMINVWNKYGELRLYGKGETDRTMQILT